MNRSPVPITILALVLFAGPASAQDASADFVAAQQQRGAPAGMVAAELQSTYRETSDRIATLLVGGGYRPAPVLTALVVDLSVPLETALQDMARDGSGGAYEPTEAEEMAQVLADAGYSAAEIADVLIQLFGAGEAEIAEVLLGVGFDASAVLTALMETPGGRAAEFVGALEGAGLSCAQIIAAIWDLDEGQTASTHFSEIVDALGSDARCSSPEIVHGLRDILCAN